MSRDEPSPGWGAVPIPARDTTIPRSDINPSAPGVSSSMAARRRRRQGPSGTPAAVARQAGPTQAVPLPLCPNTRQEDP